MATVAPRISRLLSRAQIEKMHAAALRVLDTVGCAAPEEITREVARRKGVTLRGGRICFAPEIVQKYVNENRPSGASGAPPQERTLLHAGGWAEFIYDAEADCVRPITARDLIHSCRLLDSLYDEGVRGNAVGMPSDAPIPLRGLAAFKIAAEYNEHNPPSTRVTNLETWDLLYEMHQVMGLPMSFGLHMISPLAVGGPEFDVALRLLRSGKPCSFHVGSMPMAGATAPIHFIGALVQDIAEAVSGAMVLRLLAPEANVSFGIAAYHFDMRSGSIVYGSPEDNLLSLAVMDLNEHYRGVRAGRHFCRTTAKRPGMQAAAEMAASAMFGALAGAPWFGGAGILSLDEIHSDEQLALTLEVRDYVDRAKRGFEFSRRALSVAEIADAVQRREGFLGREETAKFHRQANWTPRFFIRGAYAQAPGEDDAALRRRLRDFVAKKVRGHTYRLDAARRRELDRIYKAAVKRITK